MSATPLYPAFQPGEVVYRATVFGGGKASVTCSQVQRAVMRLCDGEWEYQVDGRFYLSSEVHGSLEDAVKAAAQPGREARP